jgi:hypothetical protein
VVLAGAGRVRRNVVHITPIYMQLNRLLCDSMFEEYEKQRGAKETENLRKT